MNRKQSPDMITTISLVIPALFGIVLARSPFESNQYMGVVLNHLQAEALHTNVDPAHLANFSTSTKHKVIFVDVNVKLDYYDGKMTGLLRVQPAGDCSAARWDFGNSTLNCTLVFNDVKFEYQAKLKYGKLPSFQVKARAEMTPTYAFAEVTSSPQYNVPHLRKLYLTHTGVIKPEFKGVGPGNKYLTKREENAFISSTASEFANVFAYNFFPSLGRAVSRAPMPLP